MSFLAFMKILESSSSRYDKGINYISLGSMKKVYDKILPYCTNDTKILDLGCGTGALTLRAGSKGSNVKGIDINAEMLNICRERVNLARLDDKITLQEKGVAEITDEQPNSYDLIMSGLCFSELSSDEIKFTLKESYRLLKPKGLLIIIDEVVPKNIFKRILHLFIRIPVVILTYILTQTTTKAIKNLPDKITSAHFSIKSTNYAFLGSLIMIVSEKPEN